MKVIIANSVGKDKQGNHYIHFPSRWTACVGKLKDFTYYPYELAYLSALLKRETNFSVKMVDGNLLQLDAGEYIDLIEKERPDWLVMETSTLVYPEDLKVALALKKRFGTKIIFAGSHPTAFPEEVINDGIDFVCLGEYEFTVLDLLSGKNPQAMPGLYPNGLRSPLDINELPFPEDGDILRFDYIYIGGCDYKEIEFFASRGCPFSCVFCVCGNLYYSKPVWRPRKIDSIIAEIKYLKEKYPQMEGIFFDEECHNINKNFILNLSEAIIKNGLNNLRYNAMCVYQTLDKEMLRAMKRAGYYKLRIGIETASSEIAQAMRKSIDSEKLKTVLSEAKRIGMKIYGTFIFGAPQSTAEQDMKTIHLMKELLNKELLVDFQSSVCTPQPGTPFYRWAESRGYLISKNWLDYTGFKAVIKYPNYSNEEIEKVYQMSKDIYLESRIKQQGLIGLWKAEVSKHGLIHTMKKAMRVMYYKSISR